MTDLLWWLAEWRTFLSRWHCIHGDDSLGAWLIGANGVTWLVYWLMGVPLVKVYRAHRANFAAAWFAAGFALFIFLCGGHHLAYLLAFKYPAYRLSAAVDASMAVVSLVVLVAFWASSDDLSLLRPYSEVLAERDAATKAKIELEVTVRERDHQNLAMASLLNDARSRLAPLEARYGRDMAYAETRQLLKDMIRTLDPSREEGDSDA